MIVDDIITRLLLTFSTLNSKNYFNFTKHPDAGLNIIRLVTKYGYPIETHKMVTEDGYHLKTYRIPHGRNQNRTNPYPVLLVHGTCGAAENFLYLGPRTSLGYFLADMGYDVWLMNNRGNFHSRKHDSLDPDNDKKFWDYSFHEIAVIDVPTNIDYILKTTGKKKLAYVGHSQGSTNYFALLTTRTEYNDKISIGVNLAPPAYLWNVTSATLVIAKHQKLLVDIADIWELWELVLPGKYNTLLRNILRFLCSEVNVLVDLCAFVFHVGDESHQFEPGSFQLILESCPAGCARKVFEHYGQIANTAEFKQYDHGKSRNVKLYGSPRPPMYDLTNITALTAYFYPEYDFSFTEQNILKMVSLTKNPIVYKITQPRFGHIDYIGGKDIMELVNKPIYHIFKKYNIS